HIDFPDYTIGELIAIAHVMLDKLSYQFAPAAERAFAEYVELRMHQPQFANARSIRNALDRARARQATRLFERGGPVTRTQLEQIDEPDIRKSRVFGAPPAG
ncbi:MAG: CbbX protein, partial [Vulcanimicrobiaceae bacterium]